MPKPLKVRRSNEIAGLFIILAAAIAIAAFFLGPSTQGWFTPTRTIAIQLPPEGSLGLRQGSDVQILGSVVGSVDDIIVTEAGEMVAEVSVRGNFIRFVREDSRAIIRKPLGIGDATIEITRGYGESYPGRGSLLQSTADKAPNQLMEEAVAAIRDEALPAIKEMRGAISEFAMLASELRGQQAGIQQALQHLNRIGEQLQEGQGLAGMLLSDPEPAAELRAALPKINNLLDEANTTLMSTRLITGKLPQMSTDIQMILRNVRETSDNARRLTAQLPELEESVGQVVGLLPGVLLQTQETLLQIERMTESLQRTWLLRGNSSGQHDPASRLNSERVGTDP